MPAAILLIVAPLAWLAHRRGWLGHPVGRAGVGVVALAVVVGALPRAGVDLVLIQRFDGALCVLVALWLWWEPRSGLARASRIAVWLTLASACVLVYFNFLAFHGARTFVHLHDAGHYYLGSKYHAELGYDGLYTAMLRAEADLYQDRFKTLEARDLTRDKLVHISELLEQSEAVKQRFSATRWRSFEQDVAYFREHLGDRLATFYRDHGFNATPVWGWLGHQLTRVVPSPARGGLRWLSLIDLGLVVGMLVAVAWAFGPRASVLALCFFCIAFGANFSWTGGAFLRQGWLFAVVVGLCCMVRGRPAMAGGLLAIAVLLRVFPVLFLVGPFAAAWFGGAAPRDRTAARRLTASAAMTLVLGFGLSCWAAGGLDVWRSFHANTQRYVETVSPNVVGATPILAFAGRPDLVTEAEFEAIRARRATIHRWQLVLLGLPTVLLVMRAFRRGPLIDAAVGGGLLLAFAFFSLAGYYYVFLLLLVLRARDADVRRVGIILFASEALVHGLTLFEPAEGIRYLYRSVVVLYVLLWVYGARLSHPFADRDPSHPDRAALAG